MECRHLDIPKIRRIQRQRWPAEHAKRPGYHRSKQVRLYIEIRTKMSFTSSAILTRRSRDRAN